MDLSSRNRLVDLNSGPRLGGNDQTQNYNVSSVGPSPPFASNWGSTIWNAPIGTGIKSTATETGRSQIKHAPPSKAPFSPDTQRGVDVNPLDQSEAITGSGSLLPESEGWSPRPSSQWSMGNMSTTLGTSRNAHTSTSPVRQRTNQHTRSNSPYFNPQQNAIGQTASNKPAFQSHLNPLSHPFSSTRQNSDDSDRRNLTSINFGSMASNSSVGYSGYNSSAASRSGSLPPSRHGAEQPSQISEVSGNGLHMSNSDIFSHRPNQLSRHSTHSVNGNSNGRFNDQSWPFNIGELTNGIGRMDVGKDTQEGSFGGYWDQSNFLPSPTSVNGNSHSNGFRSGSFSFENDSRVPQALGSHSSSRFPFNDRPSYSPTGSEARRGHDSPYFTPSIPDHSRAMSTASSRNNYSGQHDILQHRLRDLAEQQSYSQFSQTASQPYRGQYMNQGQYDYSQQALARMGGTQMPQFSGAHQLGSYNGLSHTNRNPPRGPAVQSSNAESLRSTLLEEFRLTKGSRRYELKDIYNHVVEFSGDQHGSRFIQQKLETANSDEKAQLFSELYPNCLQLMSDVFGNYVIQKFFEHGNQTQKKQLADKMRGKIAELSLQMYGCRVVQKAFEHVLADQQAELVKELEHQVLTCVKDQNGNHVIQKAIQRIPPEHIPFIISAFTGQVQALATHSYGCRVVQRMLECCPEPERFQLLGEVHTCAAQLIIDQYGNYVVQHVIKHGNPEDRIKLCDMVDSQIMVYSMHKYASNVVETSLEYGSLEHRQKIVTFISTVDENGDAPLQKLVRDQFGNYVIQKIVKQLKTSELEAFLNILRPQLARVPPSPQCSKHVQQIEKEIEKRFPPASNVPNIPNIPTAPSAFSHSNAQSNSRQPPSLDISAAPTPPLLSEDTQSPQSSSQPSTNTSTVDGPTGQRTVDIHKENSILVEVTDEDTIIAAPPTTSSTTTG